jgi:hypothetical protein
MPSVPQVWSQLLFVVLVSSCVSASVVIALYVMCVIKPLRARAMVAAARAPETLEAQEGRDQEERERPAAHEQVGGVAENGPTYMEIIAIGDQEESNIELEENTAYATALNVVEVGIGEEAIALEENAAYA